MSEFDLNKQEKTYYIIGNKQIIDADSVVSIAKVGTMFDDDPDILLSMSWGKETYANSNEIRIVKRNEAIEFITALLQKQ